MSISTPTFTIVVPNYNYAHFMDDCLSSIFNQTFSDYEVLICDGGSIDNSLSVIDKYLSDSRFKLFSTSDNGQANALNTAFKSASGKYFCYLNSDDYFITNKALSIVDRAFTEYGLIDFVSLGGYHVNQHGQFLNSIDYSHNNLYNLYNFNRRVAILQPSTFWRSSSVNPSIIPFRETFRSNFDTVFFWESYKIGKCFLISPQEKIVAYRLHSTNISHNEYYQKLIDKAAFLRLKGHSIRSYYLSFFVLIVRFLKFLFPFYLFNILIRIIRLIVNSISYLSFHYFPSF